VFVHARPETPDRLAEIMRPLGGNKLALSLITNRGVKVWPEGIPETFCTDRWRCRFTTMNGPIDHAAIVELMRRAASAGIDFIKTENLCRFDGEAGYSLGQGQ